MIDLLKHMMSAEPVRAYAIVLIVIAIMGTTIWVAVIDIIKKRITFWKMLIPSSLIILGPLMISLFCGCKQMKWFLLAALPLWLPLLFINHKFNKNKFIGRADVDLLSAIFVEDVMMSAWAAFVSEPSIAVLKVTQIWYTLTLYIVVGSVAYIALLILLFGVELAVKREEGLTLHDIMVRKVSMLPALVPIAVMVPLSNMLS